MHQQLFYNWILKGENKLEKKNYDDFELEDLDLDFEEDDRI